MSKFPDLSMVHLEKGREGVLTKFQVIRSILGIRPCYFIAAYIGSLTMDCRDDDDPQVPMVVKYQVRS